MQYSLSRIGLHRTTFGMLPALAVALLLVNTRGATAQPPAPQNNSSMIAQTVDSRKGYVLRIPLEAQLDSAASGWSRKRSCEIRVYRIPNAGLVRVTATVKAIKAPRDTVSNGAYTYTEMDSATERGTAVIRTYYMPTRSVRIELIPQALRMSRYIDASQEIFATFRWKPGAASEAIDTDP